MLTLILIFKIWAVGAVGAFIIANISHQFETEGMLGQLLAAAIWPFFAVLILYDWYDDWYSNWRWDRRERRAAEKRMERHRKDNK